MITPAIQLKENERMLLIALDPVDATSRYEMMVRSLKPFSYRVIEELGSCVLASVTVNNPSELAAALLEVFERKYFSFLVQSSDGRLVFQAIFHRAEDDNEIRSRAEFWKPAWMKKSS